MFAVIVVPHEFDNNSFRQEKLLLVLFKEKSERV